MKLGTTQPLSSMGGSTKQICTTQRCTCLKPDAPDAPVRTAHRPCLQSCVSLYCGPAKMMASWVFFLVACVEGLGPPRYRLRSTAVCRKRAGSHCGISSRHDSARRQQGGYVKESGERTSARADARPLYPLVRNDPSCYHNTRTAQMLLMPGSAARLSSKHHDMRDCR